jgi:hypothetical protein
MLVAPPFAHAWIGSFCEFVLLLEADCPFANFGKLPMTSGFRDRRSMFGNSMDDTSLASALAAEFGALAANKPEDEVKLEDTTNPMLAEIDRPSVEVIPAENPRVTKAKKRKTVEQNLNKKTQDGRAKKCKTVEQKLNKTCKVVEQKNARRSSKS